MSSTVNRYFRRASIEDNLVTTNHGTVKRTDEEKENNIIEWVTLFRRNWHIYADMVLQIKLKPFQKIWIYLIGISDVFMAICGRGGGKTFITALAAMIKLLLYPYAEIIVTSSTLPQANKLVEEKIRDELIKKLSPYLLDMYKKEYIVISKSDDGYKVENKLNGAVLRVLPCMDSARGSRACMLIYEECRLLKKNLIDSVFEKMAHPRQARYLSNPEYNKKRWLEECTSIYITSARYKFEWFAKTFRQIVTGYYIDKKTCYNFFATDIFTSIANGLKTWGDLRKSKKMSSTIDFRAEDLNEMIGENDSSFFVLKSFVENQTLAKAWIPPTNLDIFFSKEVGNAPKKDLEVRLVIADFAFANTTSSTKNDNTIIMCMSLVWNTKSNMFKRRVDYIEGWEAGDSLGAGRRIRQLRVDYKADYIVIDGRSGGESIYNSMTEPYDIPERGSYWNSHGLTVSNDRQIQVAPDAKLDDLITRTVDKEAIPCLVPVYGNAEFNSQCWIELKKQLDYNNIEFLVPLYNAQESLENSGEYFTLTSEELALKLIPYKQTELLIQEAIELTAEIRGSVIKLKEPSTGTKDRIVVLAYANYIACKIENMWARRFSLNDNYDYDEFQLVY